MTDTPKQKTTLTLGKKLELKKPADMEQVRQSFAHGRSKTVTVEVKKKRTISGDKPAELPEATQEEAVLLSHFTKDELESRLRAVKESLKEKPKEVEEASFPEIEKEEKQSYQTETLDSFQDDHQNSPQTRVPVMNAPSPGDNLPKTLDKKSSQDDKSSSYDRTKEKEPQAGSMRIKNDASHKVIPSEPRIFKAQDFKPTPKAPPKPRSAFDEEETGDAAKKKVIRVDPKKSVVTPPRKDSLALPRKLTGSALTRALNDEEAGRTRSIAAFKRARQKQKQLGTQADAMKIVREVIIPDTINVGELANRMAVRGADVIKALMKLGMMVTINQVIDGDTAELVCTEFGHMPKRVSDADIEIGLRGKEDVEESLLPRAPVITVMGHVDHGKTSLLDALRSTDVAGGEAGGITQHIGAYQVTIKSGQKITFIDTPGHAAFTEMRARGANLTDVVVLVVAADDGIMPQTIEAISHAKAANVPIVVAINKMDKPEANPERVRSELLQHGIVLEEFGGDVLSVEVSAKKRMNLGKLEEAILLQAEVLELKANPKRAAEGVVIESKVDRGRGMVATVLVQRGTLAVGDIFVAGKEWGRVRALNSDHGQKLNTALPSMPVEVLGFNGLPAAGDELFVVDSENRAREIAEYREHKEKEAKAAAVAKSNMDKILGRIAETHAKELAVVIKTDVQGSLEALTGSLLKLATDEVAVRVLHGAVGGINESDVTLARASNGIIIGFNVRANPQARDLARRDGVDIRYYSIIYDVIDEMKALLGGLLSPTLKEKFLGYAEIRDVFNITKIGKVAGCYVTEGVVKRGAKVRLLRDNVVIHEGALKTLRRFKDEVKEVKDSFECGIAFENYDDIKKSDVIECFEIEEIARVLA